MKKRIPSISILSFKNVAMLVLLFCLATFSYMILSSFNRELSSQFVDKKIDNILTDSSKQSLFTTASAENQCSAPSVLVVSQPLAVPNIPYTNLQIAGSKDVLLNPYTPPLSDERYLVPMSSAIPYGAIPVNMSSNGRVVDTAYRQVGILTPTHGSSLNSIIPLMGRPLYSRRDKWQYYTISNQHNNIKLPILVKGKSALVEYGVDALYEGDVVFIEGVDSAYKVTMYDSDTIRYLPSI